MADEAGIPKGTKTKEILDINDDGVFDFKDVLILAGIMVAGYFVVKYAKKSFLKGVV